MAGFFSPSLGFASSIGSFIGGAAGQINKNIETEHEQDRQDQILMSAKADKSIAEWKKDNKTNEAKVNLWNTVKDTYGEKAADAAISMYTANPKTPMTDIFGAASSPKLKDDAYKSNFINTLNQQSSQSTADVSGITSKLSPKYRRQIPSLAAPTYGNPNNTKPTTTMPPSTTEMAANIAPTNASTPTPMGVPPANSGGNSTISVPPSANSTISPTSEMADAGSAAPGTVGTMPDMNEGATMGSPSSGTPVAPAAPSTSPTAAGSPASALPTPIPVPSAPASEDRGNSLFPAKPETARQQFQDKLGAQQSNIALAAEQRRREEHIERLKFDKQKHADDMARKPATPEEQQKLALGTEASKVYIRDLEKRQATMGASRQMLFAANDLIRMTESSDPLKASYAQPFVDNLNRIFGSAGIDLRQLGLPANKISTINEAQKVLADMTFQNISQYHLGRWTNYEVNLLQQKLPSIGSDPNTIVKISLLFKNAAEREMKTYKEENAIAYGKSGERLGSPDPVDLGKAKSHGVNETTNQEGVTPWVQMDSRLPQTDPGNASAMKRLKPGDWFEDVATEQMRRYKG